MNYKKHNIFTGAYTLDKSLAFYPNANWLVRKQVKNSLFSADMLDEGSIVLILEDDAKAFWSVMSFLNADDVRGLIKQLQESIEED